jgi:nitroreductase
VKTVPQNGEHKLAFSVFCFFAALYSSAVANLFLIVFPSIVAATALGLGTVWVGAFDDASVQRVLAVTVCRRSPGDHQQPDQHW